MYRRHAVHLQWANEALTDPDRVELAPDPSSISGFGVRTIGYSSSAEALLSIITLDYAGATYGVNGWRSNTIDQRRYRQEGS